jgi:(2Fe-2S) ferredoxin
MMVRTELQVLRERAWYGGFTADQALRFAARWVSEPRIVDERPDPAPHMAAVGGRQFLVEYRITRTVPVAGF